MAEQQTDARRKAIAALIRDVPDFPTPGIVFKDITPLLADAARFADVIELMAAPWRGERIAQVVGVESRGFILGAPMALALGAGFVPVRKPGKLPSRTSRLEYALEYGTDSLEIHQDACEQGARVLVIDDVLATGGTAQATCALVEGIGADVVGCGFLMVLDFLPGRQRMGGRRIESVLSF
ncbi:MAG: adenine phosphoribosyltransferase [Gemmatimonadetes bacterium]|nr:adenine phosphoribosyltransferase [Gemmatimonadota bacterium]